MAEHTPARSAFPHVGDYLSGLAQDIVKVIPGLLLILALAVAARYGDIYLKQSFGDLQQILLLNYVMLAIIFGMLLRNTIGVPAVCESGLRFSTVFTKTGIVIMGSKYTLASLLQVGALSMTVITVFLFGTVFLLFWLVKRFKVSDQLTAILASGFSVCGVSAIVATGPAVRARPPDMAYGIATILIFGLVGLFTFPIIGHLIGLSQAQFGAWAGIGIMNSAQVLAAGFAYGDEAGLMGGIYNLGRVILLPFVVLGTVIYVLNRSCELQGSAKVNKLQFIKDKFPVFILAFFAAVLLNTMGAFTPEQLKVADATMVWAFSLGFASIGLTTRLSDLKAAGKDGLLLGFIVGVIKAVLALVVVLLLID